MNTIFHSPELSKVLSHLLGVLPLLVSVLALVVALKSYRRRTGVHIRGMWTTSSSREGSDDYVSEVLLENLKERAVAVFSIYLKVGHNYFIELEDLNESPLVLKPFEIYRKQFGPLEFYAVSNRRIDLNDLIRDQKRRLVLSTSEGKYEVPSGFRRWDPVLNFFTNQMTSVVHPVRSKYKNKAVGGNVKFVVEFTNEDDTSEVVLLQPGDDKLRIFNSFNLTEDSLKYKGKLESLLNQQIASGNLVCKGFKVIDLEAWRQGRFEFYSREPIKAKCYSAFEYYILGKAFTKISSWKIRRQNAALMNKSTAAVDEENEPILID